MDFKDFLRPYFVTLYLKQDEEGRYEDGKWVPGGGDDIPFKGAVAIFSDDSLQFGDAGTYTADDRRIYTYKKLERGQKVKVSDDTYTITEERDYSFYSKGLRMFVVRRDAVTSD